MCVMYLYLLPVYVTLPVMLVVNLDLTTIMVLIIDYISVPHAAEIE